MGGYDYPDIPLAVTQGTLLWQTIKFGGSSQSRHERPLLIALAFDNGFADYSAAQD